MTEQEGLTCRDVCEYIVDAFPDIGLTPQEVYSLSPTGELCPMFELYWAAKIHNGYEMRIDKRGDIAWTKDETT